MNSKTIVLSGVTLESAAADTQAAASRMTIDTDICTNLNFTVSYTTGAAETSNTCNVIVEGYDGTNWIQLGESAITGGTATYTATIYAVAGASAATTYTAHFKVDINWKKIRFGAYEAGVASNKGTVSVVAMVQ